jgi:hypothetical protein
VNLYGSSSMPASWRLMSLNEDGQVLHWRFFKELVGYNAARPGLSSKGYKTKKVFIKDGEQETRT